MKSTLLILTEASREVVCRVTCVSLSSLELGDIDAWGLLRPQSQRAARKTCKASPISLLALENGIMFPLVTPFEVKRK